MFSLGSVESNAVDVQSDSRKARMETDVDDVTPPKPVVVEGGAETGVNAGEISSSKKPETDIDAAQVKSGVDPERESGISADSARPPPTDSPPNFSKYAGTELTGNEALLGELGGSYPGVWFTYDYHDVGPQRAVEECTQLLRLGGVAVTFSLDVVHRLELFLKRYQESLKITPSKSKGKKVKFRH